MINVNSQRWWNNVEEGDDTALYIEMSTSTSAWKGMVCPHCDFVKEVHNSFARYVKLQIIVLYYAFSLYTWQSDSS